MVTKYCKTTSSILTAFVTFLLLCACTNNGPKNYDEIQKYSIKCVEKALKQLTSNIYPKDLIDNQYVQVLDYNNGNVSGFSKDLKKDILNKLNGVNFDKIVISSSVDTVMQGSKLCYSFVNVKLPESLSFQFLIQFDGKGVTGTEGNAKIRATRGLINEKLPTIVVDNIKYQVNYSNRSDLSDGYEKYLAHYAVKKIKPFIDQFNSKREPSLYPGLADFKGFLLKDSLPMPELISFEGSDKNDLFNFKHCSIKCGDIIFVYDGEKIIDSYGLFAGYDYAEALHPNSYAFCTGAKGVMNKYFSGISDTPDRQILKNIKETHKTECAKYRQLQQKAEILKRYL